MLTDVKCSVERTSFSTAARISLVKVQCNIFVGEELNITDSPFLQEEKKPYIISITYRDHIMAQWETLKICDRESILVSS